MDFKTQGEIWIQGLRTRRRKPVKQGTLDCYASYLKNWICPTLGSTEIATFGNGAMKKFVQHLGTFPIGPKTTGEIVQAVKQVVKSAVSEDGDCLYPRVWSNDFIDLPIVDKKQQKTPMIDKEDLADALKRFPSQRVFWSFLAGTGLRIAEALAVRIGDDRCNTAWDAQKAIVDVRTQIQRGCEISPKTAAGFRQVDLVPKLNQMLIDYAGDRRGGFLFENKKGGSMYETSLRASLTAAEINGFHVFRRFRITHLREYGVPEQLIKIWVGHEVGSDITDHYSKIGSNVELRKSWADRAGLGFDIEIKKKSEATKCRTIDSLTVPSTESVDAPPVIDQQVSP